jgi:hypothetical protein
MVFAAACRASKWHDRSSLHIQCRYRSGAESQFGTDHLGSRHTKTVGRFPGEIHLGAIQQFRGIRRWLRILQRNLAIGSGVGLTRGMHSLWQGIVKSKDIRGDRSPLSSDLNFLNFGFEIQESFDFTTPLKRQPITRCVVPQYLRSQRTVHVSQSVNIQQVIIGLGPRVHHPFRSHQ